MRPTLSEAIRKMKAYKYFAELVNEYIENNFDITHLTGSEKDGKPVKEEVEKIRQALFDLGYTGTAERMSANGGGF